MAAFFFAGVDCAFEVSYIVKSIENSENVNTVGN